jgi:uncharacterized protein (TIGR02466 family)
MNNANYEILFPSPILSVDLPLIKNDLLLDYVYKIKNADIIGRVKSNQGGYQSLSLNLKDKELQPLLDDISKFVSEYIVFCNFKKNITYRIQNMWFNINYYKDTNVSHIHPGCLFSGVFYLKTNTDSGDINFIHPAMELLSYDWSDEYKNTLTEKNSCNYNMPAVQNRLYIFPSWLRHLVKPNLNKNEDRISFSFNIGVENVF